MGQMTTDQYLDQIQGKLMETLTKKKDAMPPGFNQQRFAMNCITVIRDMLRDNKKRDHLQTVDINSIVLCMMKGAYLGLGFLNGECYAIPYTRQVLRLRQNIFRKRKLWMLCIWLVETIIPELMQSLIMSG